MTANRRQTTAAAQMNSGSLIFGEWNLEIPDLPVDSWLFCTVVLVVLVFFIWVVARLTSSATESIDPAEVDRQMLSAVTDLKSQGELTTEEYRSIKSRLVDRLSDERGTADSADSSDEDKPPQEKKGSVDTTTETPEGTEVFDKSDTGDNPQEAEDHVSDKDQNDRSAV